MDQSEWIDPSAAPSGPGCAECHTAEPPGWWFHLRRCAFCGHVACCDSSPGQHATDHYRRSGHPIMQSFEPGEEWFFDYRTSSVVPGPDLAPPRAHPEDQSAPGPQDRVPRDWMSRLH
jgi:hypothetical protein